MYTTDTSAFEADLAYWDKLQQLFQPVRKKAGLKCWLIIVSMLKAAWEGEELLVPTKEHPFLKNDGCRNYTKEPVDEEVPDELEPSLKMLLEDAEILRELTRALERHFTLLFCPYSGGVVIRALLSSPGGDD